MVPIFNEKVTGVCGSREQCTGALFTGEKSTIGTRKKKKKKKTERKRTRMKRRRYKSNPNRY